MKWKNLRDSFRKELKKIELARLQDDGDENRRNYGTWTHFESMQFLSPIMKPKLAVDLSDPPALEVTNVEIKEELDKRDGENESFQFVNVDKPEISPESQNSAIYPVHNMDSTNKESTIVRNDCEEPGHSWPGVEVSVNEVEMASEVSRKRKAQSNYFNYMRELLDLKARKMSLLKERCEEECDDDMNFFKSLMPHVKQLPTINKLIFRSQVQNALAQELSKLQNNPRSSPQCEPNVASTSNISSQVVTFVSRNDNSAKYESIIS